MSTTEKIKLKVDHEVSPLDKARNVRAARGGEP